MGNTVLTTKYLTAHPEYLALLSRTGMDTRTLVRDGEYVSFSIYEDGRLVWSSREFPIKGVPSSLQADFFCRDRRRVRLFFDYTRFRRGYPYRVRTNLGTPRTYISIRGVGSVFVRFPQTRYPAFVRNARRRVVGLLVAQTNTVGRIRRSSNLRPNPETRVSSFTRVDEIQNGPGDANYTLAVTPTSSPRFTRTWSGVRTPGYGRLKGRNLPVNPHSVSIKNVDANLAIHKNANPRVTFYHLWVDKYTDRYTEPAPPAHLTEPRNVVIRKLIEKAHAGVDANLAQDFAQLHQTLSIITNAASTIARAGIQVKNGNVFGAVRTLWRNAPPRYRSGNRPPRFTRSAANNWLQLQYGWKPLLSDIEGVLKAIPNLMAGGGFVGRVTASAEQRSVVTSQFNSWLIPSPIKGQTVQQIDTRCRIGIRYRIASPLQAFLNQTGFTNPINLLWEVLPFSFVADWFLPIGNYLEGLTAFQGLEFMDGYQVLFTRESCISAIHGQSIDAGSGGTLQDSQGDYAREWVLLDRTKLTAFPSQSFSWSPSNGLSRVTTAANAIALVRQVFGR